MDFWYFTAHEKILLHLQLKCLYLLVQYAAVIDIVESAFMNPTTNAVPVAGKAILTDPPKMAYESQSEIK